MDKGPFHLVQGASQQRQSRLRHNVFQSQSVQAPRPIAPRQRYRAAQYDHPMYDEVDDDDYEKGAAFDAFDECMLQQPNNDRQHQAIEGRARLSLAPASFRSLSGKIDEQEPPQPRRYPTYAETCEDRNRQACQGNTTHGSLSRFAYTATRTLESSSDIPLGASSSPALDAGRRQAGQYDFSASQHPSRVQTFEELPPPSTFERRRDNGYSYDEKQVLSRPPRWEINHLSQQTTDARSKSDPTTLTHALPVVQGISLVPVFALPDRLRTVFPFPTFNAVQSKCFDQIFKTNNNFVLASPTGSGKTAILELAICRAVATNLTDQYKVVYQAPTKALCSERRQDWSKKFAQIGLRCAELTGDSDASDLCNVQSANIIITTPEKWDSMTRKWKDHEKLMSLITLFLIDEVHILKEDRGAVLEVVVSRMKSISTNVRFVALSATIPNFCDVAAWLGRSTAEPYVPASSARFGEEFRPVKLRKHVFGYVGNQNNDFAFEKQLDTNLPDIIAKYSERKPIMIFCATRKSCAVTARLLAQWWNSKSGQDRFWCAPTQAIHTKDQNLRQLVASGVACHHAGLVSEDRMEVEKGFLQGDINVICCTSTLAVGVNLPCHLVIIKNTVSWTQDGLQEYSDLEMMQMLGRAGRPQFDDSAVAVIMTRQTKVRRYETLATGEEVMESKLHLNLIEHMNAEIGLGTIQDLDSARRWLTSTFLYVRLQQNPAFYKLKDSRDGESIQEQVDEICYRDIALLREQNLATGEVGFRCTEYGHAMTRYYVRFETMKLFMGLRPKATLSEILSIITQAIEFSKFRFRQGEKSFYKTLNKSPSIRFPIPVNLDLPAQKVSLIIQSVLGRADIPSDGDMNKHRQQYLQDMAMIFKSVSSLTRCVIDCHICSGDSVSIHSALVLERCLESRAWDDSPLQMTQVPSIGVVAVRKLVNAAIRSIEDLESTGAHDIERIIGKNPPFGLQVLDALKSFPKLRVLLHVQPSSTTKGPEGVTIRVKADIGFVNKTPPNNFNRKPIYVCILAETSDGRKAHFARINGCKLGAGQNLVFPVLLTSANQKINCYLMCEGIAGSMRCATVAPSIAPSMFPSKALRTVERTPTHPPNVSRRRIENTPMQRKKSAASDDFGDTDIDDYSLIQATCEDASFEHIDNFTVHDNTAKIKSAKEKGRAKALSNTTKKVDDGAPIRLPNGKWACSHKCKDKEACRHYCCKHGMEKPSKKAVAKPIPTGEHRELQEQPPPKTRTMMTQTKLHVSASKRKSSDAIEVLDLTQQEKKQKIDYAIDGPRNYRNLHSLHQSVQKIDTPPSLHSIIHSKPAYCCSEGGEHPLSFLSQRSSAQRNSSSEYGDLRLGEFDTESSRIQNDSTLSDGLTSLHFPGKAPVPPNGSDTFGDDDSILGQAIVGLADSQDLQRASVMGNSSMHNHEVQTAIDTAEQFVDVSLNVNNDLVVNEKLPHKARAPLFDAKKRPENQLQNLKPMKAELQDEKLQPPQQGKIGPHAPVHASKEDSEEKDVYSDLMDLLDEAPASKDELTTSKHGLFVSKTPRHPPRARDEGQEQADGFKDLQPWLFWEFGNIVELVDE